MVAAAAGVRYLGKVGRLEDKGGHTSMGTCRREKVVLEAEGSMALSFTMVIS